MIKKMADDNVKFNLAVSLHSAIDEVRSSIMPFNKTFPLNDLREALEYWYAKTKRKISYEYVVWKGINDTQKDIDAFGFGWNLPPKESVKNDLQILVDKNSIEYIDLIVLIYS